MEQEKLYPYTLFIDILGYSNKIKSISNSSESSEIFDLLDYIESLIADYFKSAKNSNSHKEYNMHYAFFSDCIILSFVPKENLTIPNNEILYFNETTLEFIFTWIMNIQFISLLKTGFLLRGGISIKDIYWDTKNRVVGPALIEAYNLESKKADWPRIILSEDITKDKELIHLLNNTSMQSDSTYLPHTLIYQENNESISYYNYIGRILARLNPNVLDEIDKNVLPHLSENIKNNITEETFIKIAEITDAFLEQHQDIIRNNLYHSDEKIKNKYIQLKKYHNYALEDFVKYNNEWSILLELQVT